MRGTFTKKEALKFVEEELSIFKDNLIKLDTELEQNYIYTDERKKVLYWGKMVNFMNSIMDLNKFDFDNRKSEIESLCIIYDITNIDHEKCVSCSQYEKCEDYRMDIYNYILSIENKIS